MTLVEKNMVVFPSLVAVKTLFGPFPTVAAQHTKKYLDSVLNGQSEEVFMTVLVTFSVIKTVAFR